MMVKFYRVTVTDAEQDVLKAPIKRAAKVRRENFYPCSAPVVGRRGKGSGEYRRSISGECTNRSAGTQR
jgi:hypothetical protein